MNIDMSSWQGRIDPEDGDNGMRFHQKVQPADTENEPGVTLLGFACDEGVFRNKGRMGARGGPSEIRKALANMAWHHRLPIYDGGDTHCDNHDLTKAQKSLADNITQALHQQHFPLTMGGGHEVAWASFQGLANHLIQIGISIPPRIGIINFDAHFDLRTPSGDSLTGSSGTPFAQIAEFCASQNWPFNYACLGVSRTSNTQALFNKADELNVLTVEDHQLHPTSLQSIQGSLATFIEQCDHLYLTIDMDVFPAATAPGVSAPAAHGVDYPMVEALLKPILNAKSEHGNSKLRLADIAEYNPRYDIDGHTSRLAARLIWTILRKLNTTFTNKEYRDDRSATG
ncbi:formimidoylglutamase [Photobacterium sp. SKA34]|uniref:formimidoylglutamase n=1 Tax=Photobacterium sp. SKA34 TaxID=121723 RepID=UPI00006B4111|nr:formimidoylglutamase [Photobacterium sp. SKA34]EAR57685.1 formimidoylglutamase [Photobacterium sp. SKA34]